MRLPGGRGSRGGGRRGKNEGTGRHGRTSLVGGAGQPGYGGGQAGYGGQPRYGTGQPDYDGQPGYREVQGGPVAVSALRAAHPDEALVAVLGTDTDDPWSPAADKVLDRCFALAEAGANGVRLEGRPGRPALLDRLALAERIRRQTKLFTVVGAAAGHIDDLVDGIVAGRADLVAISD